MSGQENVLATLGDFKPKAVHHNWNEAALYQEAVRRGEGEIAKDGPLVVKTGQHTGRSAKDKFTVRDALTEDTVWWGEHNQPMTPEQFDTLWSDFQEYMNDKELFVQDLFGGADPAHRISVRVVSQFAWHSLFIRHLLRIPGAEDLAQFAPQFTIVNLPFFEADPERYGCRSETVIGVNFSKRMILIGGTKYAGETKKSVFTILNYLLPQKGVLPMHCSVNVGDKDDPAIFFGLSGTGKTTLSADPSRTLVGDDEHGWSRNGLFNIEDGCYAKMIKLSPVAEPDIYATTKMWGTVLENVVMDPVTRELDLDDPTLAENSRAAYPMTAVSNASPTGVCGQPKNVVMLTCDAFGVMPPIAKLTPAQAIYHFLSGYTAKIAGTERGVTEPTATFSTCFGAPFMPRHPTDYGALLGDYIAENGVNCWLVSTGWTGGAYGVGERMPIQATRALLAAVLDGSLADAEFRTDPTFGFEVPVSAPNVDTSLLNPRSTWSDVAAYDAQAAKLANMFVENFAKFEAQVSPDVRAAAPRPDDAVIVAAE